MPTIPPGTNLGILPTYKPSAIEVMMDGTPIPNQGPHRTQHIQYGFKVIRDFNVPFSRASFTKGMTGQLLEVRDEKANIYIQGMTEYTNKGKWIKNLRVDTGNMERGEEWRHSVRDWEVMMNRPARPISAHMSSAAPDTHTSTIGKTIFTLLDASHTSPHPCLFMGTKPQDFIHGKKYDVGHITTKIVQGLKDANVHDTIDRPSLACYDGSSGVYLRYHKSASSIKSW